MGLFNENGPVQAPVRSDMGMRRAPARASSTLKALTAKPAEPRTRKVDQVEVLPQIDMTVRRENGKNLYFLSGAQMPSFVGDEQRMVFKTNMPSDIEIIAMLKAATEAYGAIELFGPREFMVRAAELAGRYGFAIANTDIADAYERGASEAAEAAPAP